MARRGWLGCLLTEWIAVASRNSGVEPGGPPPHRTTWLRCAELTTIGRTPAATRNPGVAVEVAALKNLASSNGFLQSLGFTTE